MRPLSRIGWPDFNKKDVERPKFRASDVAEEVRKAGFHKFRVQREHLDMWKVEDAKNPGKGYGVDVQGVWYWYQSWIDRCIDLCERDPVKYGKKAPAPSQDKATQKTTEIAAAKMSPEA